MVRLGTWPGALVEGPFGFDNAISLEAARITKKSTLASGVMPTC
jgi:phosphate acetyltransferase/phosphate butyryltransferase